MGDAPVVADPNQWAQKPYDQACLDKETTVREIFRTSFLIQDEEAAVRLVTRKLILPRNIALPATLREQYELLSRACTEPPLEQAVAEAIGAMKRSLPKTSEPATESAPPTLESIITLATAATETMRNVQGSGEGGSNRPREPAAPGIPFSVPRFPAFAERAVNVQLWMKRFEKRTTKLELDALTNEWTNAVRNYIGHPRSRGVAFRLESLCMQLEDLIGITAHTHNHEVPLAPSHWRSLFMLMEQVTITRLVNEQSKMVTEFCSRCEVNRRTGYWDPYDAYSAVSRRKNSGDKRGRDELDRD